MNNKKILNILTIVATIVLYGCAPAPKAWSDADKEHAMLLIGSTVEDVGNIATTRFWDEKSLIPAEVQVGIITTLSAEEASAIISQNLIKNNLLESGKNLTCYDLMGTKQGPSDIVCDNEVIKFSVDATGETGVERQINLSVPLGGLPSSAP